MNNKIAAIVEGLDTNDKRAFYNLALELKVTPSEKRQTVLEGLGDNISPAVRSAIRSLYMDGDPARVIDKLRQKA